MFLMTIKIVWSEGGEQYYELESNGFQKYCSLSLLILSHVFLCLKLSKPAPPSSCQEHLSHMKWLAHKESLRLSCCWFWSSLEHCRTCIFHMMRKVHGKNTPDLRISSWLCHWPIIAPWYIPNADDWSRNFIRTDNRCTSCIRGRQAQQVLDELVTHHIS